MTAFSVLLLHEMMMFGHIPPDVFQLLAVRRNERV
jgi:hypothetical protein